MIRNNTIVNNYGATGIYNAYGTAPTISNCILWGNNDDLYNCSATYSCISDPNDANGAGNIISDPNFIDPQYYDYHLASDSPCIDAGDPNGDYDGQTDIDGHPRVMVTEVDMGADEAAYLPACRPDYDEWVEIGQPVSWCYPRQCHGDADGLKLLDPNDPVGPFWVQQNDLDILVAGWHQPYSGDPEEDPWIAADFDRKEEGGAKTGYFRVSFNDLNILTASWKQADANVPGDCSD